MFSNAVSLPATNLSSTGSSSTDLSAGEQSTNVTVAPPAAIHSSLNPTAPSHLRAPSNDSGIDWKGIEAKLSVPKSSINRLVVGVSSGALFDMKTDHSIRDQHGMDAYRQFHWDHKEEVMAPGDAFPLVQKLLALNAELDENACVEVVIISKNPPESSVRIFNSINHYQLPIIRSAFTGGSQPYQYAKAFGTDLYLSTNPEDVSVALEENIPAATIIPSKNQTQLDEPIRIAFDGDAVVFSDESEQISQREGFEAFYDNEKALADTPMNGGPIKPFLESLKQIKNHSKDPNKEVIRLAIVTARSAPAHERVVNTLKSWDIPVDEFLFLGGLNKAPFLSAYKADMFFDDKKSNCLSAAEEVTTGHVPHGVLNETVLNEKGAMRG